MLGNIKIFFGKVVSVTDELKIFRCRISIGGYTDNIVADDLPWYFPWYGLNYLPVLNDVVSVIVFDDNFSTAFYGKKVNLTDQLLDDGDYENYLEIFKRTISDKNISLTYKVSTGIEFINDTSKIQLEINKVSIFSDANSIVITPERIDIGNQNQEASLLGDKAVAELHAIITHQANTISEMLKMFNAISSACVTPFTAPIKAVLTPLITAAQTALNNENSQVDADADTIQSVKVFIE